MSYAEKTSVAFEKSIAEIVTLIKKSGASQIAQFEGESEFAVQFTLADRLIRFRLPLPSINGIPLRNGRHQAYSQKQRGELLNQQIRSRGRALLLVIKAKMESVESGIETIEQAFLAHVVMANGQTVFERIQGPIALEYREGKPDATMGLLPPPGASA